jgi:cation transport protein ChaC
LEAGLDFHVLSDAELQTSIQSTLKHQTPGSDVHLFAYGSLIWNPIFKFDERFVGKVYGFHRRFCLWTPLGRGTPDNPGLVLGLDHGGSCRGVVYRIAGADVASELLLLWRREMIIGSYIPRWVKVMHDDREVNAIAFVINRSHHHYAGNISHDVMVQHIATAHGLIGSCSDYLLQTVDGLASSGICDRQLLHLKRQVLAKQM